MARRSLHVAVPSPTGASGLEGLTGMATALAKVASEQGYAAEVLEPKPTKEAFRAALDRLTSGLASGDSIWFTFAGHGVAGDGRPDDGLTRQDKFMMLEGDSFCNVDLMNVWLSLPAGVSVFLLFDCCRAKDIARGTLRAFLLAMLARLMGSPARLLCEESRGSLADVKASVRFLASTGTAIERPPWLSRALLDVMAGGGAPTFGELEARLRVAGQNQRVAPDLLRAGAFGAGDATFRTLEPFA